MARRKNVKRIDPRYFLHETVNRGEELEEDKSKRPEPYVDPTEEPEERHAKEEPELEEGCPHAEEGGEAIDISAPGMEVHVDDISQLSPEEAFAAGMAAARDAIDQAMGGPDGPPPEGGFSGGGPMGEPAMHETIDEGVKDYIKSPALPSSIPYGSLAKVVLANRDLLDIIKSDSVEPAVLAQKAQAFAKVGELLAQDVDIAPIAAKAGGVDNILDVRGFIKWADATGQFHRLGN